MEFYCGKDSFKASSERPNTRREGCPKFVVAMLNEEELLKKLEGIEGLLCRSQAYWLYEHAYRLPADGSAILEIGCHHGYSAAAMALGCVGTGRRVYTIDSDRSSLDIANAHWVRLGLGRLIYSYNSDSARLIKMSDSFGWPKFDFAFIDGDHVAPAPMRDFAAVAVLMNVGGRIAFHDNTEAWPDVMAVWNDMAAPVLENHEFCETIASGTV